MRRPWAVLSAGRDRGTRPAQPPGVSVLIDQSVVLAIGVALIVAVAGVVALATATAARSRADATADAPRRDQRLAPHPDEAARTGWQSPLRRSVPSMVTPGSARQVARVVAFLFLASVAMVVAVTRAWPDPKPRSSRSSRWECSSSCSSWTCFRRPRWALAPPGRGTRGDRPARSADVAHRGHRQPVLRGLLPRRRRHRALGRGTRTAGHRSDRGPHGAPRSGC